MNKNKTKLSIYVWLFFGGKYIDSLVKI